MPSIQDPITMLENRLNEQDARMTKLKATNFPAEAQRILIALNQNQKTIEGMAGSITSKKQTARIIKRIQFYKDTLYDLNKMEDLWDQLSSCWVESDDEPQELTRLYNKIEFVEKEKLVERFNELKQKLSLTLSLPFKLEDIKKNVVTKIIANVINLSTKIAGDKKESSLLQDAKNLLALLLKCQSGINIPSKKISPNFKNSLKDTIKKLSDYIDTLEKWLTTMQAHIKTLTTLLENATNALLELKETDRPQFSAQLVQAKEQLDAFSKKLSTVSLNNNKGVEKDFLTLAREITELANDLNIKRKEARDMTSLTLTNNIIEKITAFADQSLNQTPTELLKLEAKIAKSFQYYIEKIRTIMDPDEIRDLQDSRISDTVKRAKETIAQAANTYVQNAIDAKEQLTAISEENSDTRQKITPKSVETLLHTSLPALQSVATTDFITLKSLGVSADKIGSFNTAIAAATPDFFEKCHSSLTQIQTELKFQLDATSDQLRQLADTLNALNVSASRLKNSDFSRKIESLIATYNAFTNGDTLDNCSLKDFADIEKRITALTNAIESAQNQETALINQKKIIPVETILKKINATALSEAEKSVLDLNQAPNILATAILKKRVATAKEALISALKMTIPTLRDNEIPDTIHNAGISEDTTVLQSELATIDNFHKTAAVKILLKRIASAKKIRIDKIFENFALPKDVILKHPFFSAHISENASIGTLETILANYNTQLDQRSILFYQNKVMQDYLTNKIYGYGIHEDLLSIEKTFTLFQDNKLSRLIDNPFQLDHAQLKEQNALLKTILKQEDVFISALLHEAIRLENEEIEKKFEARFGTRFGDTLFLDKLAIPEKTASLSDLQSQLQQLKTVNSLHTDDLFSSILKRRQAMLWTKIIEKLNNLLGDKLNENEEKNLPIIFKLSSQIDLNSVENNYIKLKDILRTNIEIVAKEILLDRIHEKEQALYMAVTTTLKLIDPSIADVMPDNSDDRHTMETGFHTLMMMPVSTLDELKAKLLALTHEITLLEAPSSYSQKIAILIMGARVATAEEKTNKVLKDHLSAQKIFSTENEIDAVINTIKDTPYGLTHFARIAEDENTMSAQIVRATQKQLMTYTSLLETPAMIKRLENEAIILYAKEALQKQAHDLYAGVTDQAITTLNDPKINRLLQPINESLTDELLQQRATALTLAIKNNAAAKAIALAVLSHTVKEQQKAIIAETALTQQEAKIYFPKTDPNHTRVAALFNSPSKKLWESEDQAIARLKEQLDSLNGFVDHILYRQGEALAVKQEQWTAYLEKTAQKSIGLLIDETVFDKARETLKKIKDPSKMAVDAIALQAAIDALRHCLQPEHAKNSFDLDHDKAGKMYHEWMTCDTTALSNNALQNLLENLKGYYRLLNPIAFQYKDSLAGIFSKNDYTKIATALSNAVDESKLTLADQSTVIVTPAKENSVVYDEKKAALTTRYQLTFTDAALQTQQNTEVHLQCKVLEDNKERKVIWQTTSKEPISFEIESTLVARDSLKLRLAEKQVLKEKITRLDRQIAVMPEGIQKTQLMEQLKKLKAQNKQFKPTELLLSIKNDSGQKEAFQLADGTPIVTTQNVFTSMKAHFKAGYTAICIDNVIYRNSASSRQTQLPSVIAHRYEDKKVQEAVQNKKQFVQTTFDPQSTISFEDYLKINARCLAAGADFLKPVVVAVPVVMTADEVDVLINDFQLEDLKALFNHLAITTKKDLQLPSSVSVVPLITIEGIDNAEIKALAQHQLEQHMANGHSVLCSAKPEDEEAIAAYQDILNTCNGPNTYHGNIPPDLS